MRSVWVVVLIVVGAAVGGAQQPQEQPRRGLDFSGMDRGVRPGDGFYRFANGGWDKRTVIPPDRPAWGTGGPVRMLVQTRLRALLDAASRSDARERTTEQRVGAFFASALDTARLDRRGIEPLRPYLDSLDALSTKDDVLSFEARHIPLLGGSLVPIFVMPDLRQPTRFQLHLWQADFGLPDAPYYAATDSATVALRRAYRTYLARLLTLSGASEPEAERLADDQLRFENALAAHSKDATALRDWSAGVNPFSIRDLAKAYPHLRIDRYVREAGVVADTIIAVVPANIPAVDSLVGAASVETLRTRLRLKILRDWAPYLSRPFRVAEFAYSGTAVSGTPEPLPRWQLASTLIDQYAGELVGRLYVERYFTPAARARAEELVRNLKSVLRTRITSNAWMSPPTKAEALRKLDAVRVQVGHPAKWQDYAGVGFDRADLFGNLLGMRRWQWRRDAGRAGQPVDPDEWVGTPVTVDAWANPALVTITFPAGILQPPFFDVDADDALNYGAIGAIIGHELVHLFDDQGRRFDHTGALRDWWTPADTIAFTTRAQRVVDQYDAYTVLDSLSVKGRLTLGENIADLGGLMAAYDAFKLTPQGKSAQKIQGLTPDERFFLAYGQSWRRLTRDNALRLLVQTDPHAPVQFRVDGPLSNFDAFYRVFKVVPGQKLYRPPAERAHIW